MKSILSLLLLMTLCVMTCNAQSTLEVNIKKCKTDEPAHLFGFKLFRNDSLIKVITTGIESKHILKDLKYGSYKIEYVSMFKKTEYTTIELSKRKTYTVDLCIDDINYESEAYQPLINQLNEGEHYSINITTEGCYHRSEQELTIRKASGQYYMTYNGKDKLLSKDDIKAIEHFEIELNYMEPYGCTSVDYYVLKYNNREVRINDGSCSWNGLSNLKQKLNLNS